MLFQRSPVSITAGDGQKPPGGDRKPETGQVRWDTKGYTLWYSDLVGFYGDLMGSYSDLMGFYSDFIGFYSDLIGFYSVLCDFIVI